MNRLDDFPKPIVAAIHGACLGGGLELALACHWRIATDSPEDPARPAGGAARAHPGAGGIQRLPRLIGARAALDIILAGKSERAQKALRLGHGGRGRAARASSARSRSPRPSGWRSEGQPRRHTAGRRQPASSSTARRSAASWSSGRRASRCSRRPAATTRRRIAALEVVRIGAGTRDRAGARGGARALRRAGGVGDVSRKLVQIFFATTALKKDDGVPTGTGAEPRPVRRIGVLGAGFMGAGIAGTAVLNAEVEARLKDADLPRVGQGIRAAHGDPRRAAQAPAAHPSAARAAHRAALRQPRTTAASRRADLVIEAVFEDLAVKRRVLQRGRGEVSAGGDLRLQHLDDPHRPRSPRAPRRPERVIGHALLLAGGEDAAARGDSARRHRRRARSSPTCGSAGSMGKTVIVVRDGPGFCQPRSCSPYLNEAGILLRGGRADRRRSTPR